VRIGSITPQDDPRPERRAEFGLAPADRSAEMARCAATCMTLEPGRAIFGFWPLNGVK